MSKHLSMFNSGSDWSKIQVVFFACFLFFLSSCGGSSSQSLNPGDEFLGGSTIDRSVDNTDEETPVFDVDAGALQVSDSNVVVRLNGDASLEGGLEPSAVLWQQISGPQVTIMNSEQLICDVVISDFTEPTQLDFQLTVWNENDESNSAYTTIRVQPQDAFARVTGGEVNESDGTASFGIFLNAPSNETIYINYTTLDGTAIANEDYIPVSGELVFSPGETEKTVTVTLIDDSEIEPAEDFQLQISSNLEDREFAISGAVIIANEQDPQLDQTIQFLAGDSATMEVGTILDSQLDTTQAPGTGRLLVSSSDPTVATIDETGLISALAVGSTTMTALKEADETYQSASTNITINVIDDTNLQDQEVAFEKPGPQEIFDDETLSNPLIINNGVSEGISYVSSDENIATVSNTGMAIPVSEGVVTISANVPGNDQFAPTSASYELTIMARPNLILQEIRFVAGSDVSLTVGSGIDGSLDTSAAPGSGAITYSNSNPQVATLDNGTFVANAIGTTTITATKAADDTYDSASTSITIEVIEQQSTRVEQDIEFERSGPQEIFVDETLSNPLIINQGANAVISYSSSNSNIAEVDETGLVTPVSSGNVTITANVPGDDDYLEAEASYSLTINERPALQDQRLIFIPASDVNQVNGVVQITVGSSANVVLDTSNAPGTGVITFRYSNEGVAEFDNDVINALSTGTTIITATKAADDNYKSTFATITVEVIEEQVTLREQEIRFELDGPQEIFDDETLSNPIIVVQGVSDGISYSSSNSNIARVDSSGMVTPLSSGGVTITANVLGNDEFLEAETSYSLTVVARVPTKEPQQLSFIAGNEVTMTVGTSIDGSLDMSNAPGSGEISFSNSNSNVAFLDDGEIIAAEIGTTTITADKEEDASYEATSASITVTVIAAQDNRIEQDVEFELAGPLQIELDESLINPLLINDGVPDSTTYSSSNENVATVDGSGQVSPVSPGTVTITAEVPGNSEFLPAEATYQLTVNEPPEPEDQRIVFVPGRDANVVNGVVEIVTGSSANVVLNTSNAPGTGEITFTYSNQGVAEFTDDVISAIDNGTTTITATKAADDNYNAATDSIQVRVVDPTPTLDQRIRFVPSQPLTMIVGTTETVELNTDDAPGDGDITFSSSNENVAQYDDGVVYANGIGTATITANKEADNTYRATSTTIEITVVDRRQQDVEFELAGPLQIELDESLINPLLIDDGVPDSTTYSSSNENVATVDGSGQVSPVSPGTVTITAEVTGNSEFLPAEASYELTINERAQPQDQRIRFVPDSDANVVNGVLEIVVGSSANVALDTSSALGTGEITFTYSNIGVAEFNDGVISSIDNGTTTITATKAADDNYNAATDSIQVRVVDPTPTLDQRIRFVPSQPLTMIVGTTENVELNTDDAPGSGAITFSSSNENVAQYDDGVVYANGIGTATITANKEADNTYRATSTTIEITVVDRRQQDVEFELAGPLQMELDESLINPILINDGVPDSTTYSSSNENVATVDGSGQVSPVSPGTVTITAEVPGNSEFLPAEATYQLTVNEPPEPEDQRIVFVPGRDANVVNGVVEIVVGSSANVVLNTSNAPGTGEITFSYSNQGVAEFSDDGISAIDNGTTTITATKAADDNYNAATDSIQVRVVDPTPTLDQRIRFVPSQPLTMIVGTTETVELNTDDAPGDGDITFSSSNENVAQYDDGVVYANGIGTATITANKEADNTYRATSTTIEITVVDRQQQDVEFEFAGPLQMELDESLINPLLINDGVPDSTTYSSSNENIATVDGSGQVSPVSPGTVTITAEVLGNSEFLPAEATYQLTVNEQPEPKDQTIRFSPYPDVNIVRGVIEIEVGSYAQVDLDTSNAPGTGEITFTYSDKDVAEFKDGIISTIDNGTTTITATKAADDNYNAATDSIQVRVVDPAPTLDQQIRFKPSQPLTMIVGTTENVELNTDDAPGDGDITFSSSNENVAQYDDGVIYANGIGTATITANKEADNTYRATSTTIDITVVDRRQQDVEFERAGPLRVAVDNILVNPLIINDGVTDGTTYASSNTKIATVDNEGQVTGVSPGKVTISANVSGNSEFLPTRASYEVTVYGNPTLKEQQIQFVPSETWTLIVGSSRKIQMDLSNAPGSGEIVIQSSNDKIAQYDSGIIYANTVGRATLRAIKEADAEYQSATTTVNIIVIDRREQDIEFERPGPISTRVGNTFSNPLIVNEGVPDGITYSTSNSKIATVSDSGEVRALAQGNVTISAQVPGNSEYEEASASYRLTVNNRLINPELPIGSNPPALDITN